VFAELSSSELPYSPPEGADTLADTAFCWFRRDDGLFESDPAALLLEEVGLPC
jgi:hypothetical protein